MDGRNPFADRIVAQCVSVRGCIPFMMRLMTYREIPDYRPCCGAHLVPALS